MTDTRTKNNWLLGTYEYADIFQGERLNSGIPIPEFVQLEHFAEHVSGDFHFIIYRNVIIDIETQANVQLPDKEHSYYIEAVAAEHPYYGHCTSYSITNLELL